jgi:hypothetical protein
MEEERNQNQTQLEKENEESTFQVNLRKENFQQIETDLNKREV